MLGQRRKQWFNIMPAVGKRTIARLAPDSNITQIDAIFLLYMHKKHMRSERSSLSVT